MRLKSETEEHLFGGFDDGAPPAAVAVPGGGGGGGGGIGELACLNDVATDLHHQAMRAERDAMVAAGLAPASLTDLEASNFYLHANGSGPHAGMAIDGGGRGREDEDAAMERAMERAKSPLLQSKNNHTDVVRAKEREKTATYSKVTSKAPPPPPQRQKSASLERHSAARQQKMETSPTKSQGGEHHIHHSHRHHHLQIYQPPSQHQLASVPPPVTSASADSLVGTVELHLDKSEPPFAASEKQGGAKRRAAAAAAVAAVNRQEKEHSSSRRRHVVRSNNRRSHGENGSEIAMTALMDSTKSENAGATATDQVNHVMYQSK